MSLTRLNDDDCAQHAQESMQKGTHDYVMNLSYWMRGKRCYPGGVGQVCTTYGPLDNTTYGRQVTRDSYLSGRGQPLSKCPKDQVRHLPEELFESVESTHGSIMKSHDLTPSNRTPKSCSSISETDTTVYAFMPRYYHDDTASMLSSFGQNSKMMTSAKLAQENANNKKAQQGKTSYGYYSKRPSRYA